MWDCLCASLSMNEVQESKRWMLLNNLIAVEINADSLKMNVLDMKKVMCLFN